MKRSNILLAAGMAMLILTSIDASSCTTAVVSGKATPDGRPLLWKHRDTWAVKNKIVQFFDGKYACTGLVNSVDSTNKSIWIGYNVKGFSIMNSASYNLNEDTLKQSGHEGRLMKKALQNCATVDEFERMLSGLEKPIRLEANFGVIDAHGNAAYFELGNYGFRKYDANDPEDAPNGYIIRTNYSNSGSHGVGGGYIRYLTASRVFQDAYEANNLTHRTLFQNTSRNLTHGLTRTDLNKYVIYPEGNQTMVYFKDYIPRSGTSSSCVVQGVKADEDPELSTMWSVVGFPLTSVVTPIWLHEAVALPEAVSYNPELKDSPISNYSLALKDRIYAYKLGSHADYYIDINKVINASNTGYIQILEPLENQIMEKSELVFAKWRKSGSVNPAELEAFYQWLDQMIFTTYRKKFNF
ncbi:MAG: hypothetical protein U9R49_04235 [Bacteroidota bacterium]|nr:hypothetical protein [Bacteroidota bacterium]